MVSMLTKTASTLVQRIEKSVTTPFLQINDICVDYLIENSTRLHALDHVSFSLSQGLALGM